MGLSARSSAGGAELQAWAPRTLVRGLVRTATRSWLAGYEEGPLLLHHSAGSELGACLCDDEEASQSAPEKRMDGLSLRAENGMCG